MSEYGTVKRENIENIADAIREKLGSEDDYTPSQMASAILQIETGGVDTLNELLNGRLSVVSSDCTLLSNYALSYFNGNQMSGYFPELTAVKTYTFTSSPFVYLNTPKLSSAGNYFARYCPLTSVHMPELRDAGQYAFGGTKFTEINDNMFPKLISCNSYAFNNAATTT